MTKIKICGLTRLDDVIWANELLPDYVGFIFAESRRRIDEKKANEIARKLDPKIKKIGVFVNSTMDYIDSVLSDCMIDIIQLHGEESPSFCSRSSLPVWKAFRIKTRDSLNDIKNYNVKAILLDGYHPNAYGGVGVSFPWNWANEIDTNDTSIVIAGGIDADNVVSVIKKLKPFAVDVSSSVETNGIKDRRKIKNFLRRVHEYEN